MSEQFVRKSFQFEDDKYDHLDWRVVLRDDAVTFHANVDHDDEPYDPNAGEFALTLSWKQIADLIDMRFPVRYVAGTEEDQQ